MSVAVTEDISILETRAPQPGNGEMAESFIIENFLLAPDCTVYLSFPSGRAAISLEL
jgi:hypothetical protein